MKEEIAKIIAELAKASANQASGESTDTLSREQKVELFKSIASDEVARDTYAKTRADVILQLIPQQSTVRNIFMPENLGPQGQPEYPVSFERTQVASYMPRLGGHTVHQYEGTSIIIPTFGIQAGHEYSMDIAEQGRLDIARLSDENLMSDIVLKEEVAGWGVIKGVLAAVNANQTVYCSGTSEPFHAFTKKAINKLGVQMDLQRRQLTDLYASPRSIADIKEWSNQQVDYLTQRDIFVNGGLPNGRIWDTRLNKVYNSNLVGNAEVYGFDTNKFGRMPIRKALETYQNPTSILRRMIGVLAYEAVGFGCTDSYSVVKGVLDADHVTAACDTF